MTSCARRSMRHLRSLMTMSRLRTPTVSHSKRVALQNSNRTATEKRRRPSLQCPSSAEPPARSRPRFGFMVSRRRRSLRFSMMRFSRLVLKPAVLHYILGLQVSLSAELTGCLDLAFIGVLRLPLIVLTTSRKRSCIIEGVSSETGISYRWTRAQAHLAVMEEKEVSCYHCMIDIPGSC